MENLVTFEDKSCFGDVFHELDEFRNTKQHCDFVIKVGSEELFVHRLILSASSGYFKGMLKHDTLESQSGFVEMKEVDPESVKFCIAFIYKGIISVPNEIREDLIHVASVLQLQKLCDLIADSYIKDLQASTFFCIKKLADMYACKNLEEKCGEFALENFVTLSEMEDFNHLDHEYIAFLVGSKKNKSLAQYKVKAVICWSKFDLKEREQHFYHILAMTDLSQLSRGHLKYLVEKVDLVSSSFDCIRLICKSLLHNVHVAPIDFTDNQVQSIAFFDDVSRHLQLFNPKSYSCTKMHRLLDNMVIDSFTAVAMQGDIYVFLRNKTVYGLQCSDSSATWTRLCDMLEEHGNRPPAVVVENNIFIAGVYYPLMPSNSVEIYDPITDIWTKSVNRNFICINSSPVYSKGYLYCIGGREGEVRLASAERLNVTTMTWSNIASMQIARSSPSAAVFQNNLYVLGGHSGHQSLKDAEYYNPDNNIWTSFTTMLSGRTLSVSYKFTDYGVSWIEYTVNLFQSSKPLFHSSYHREGVEW